MGKSMVNFVADLCILQRTRICILEYAVIQIQCLSIHIRILKFAKIRIGEINNADTPSREPDIHHWVCRNEYRQMVGMHRLMHDFAGYLANLKVGYQISGHAGYQRSGYFLYPQLIIFWKKSHLHFPILQIFSSLCFERPSSCIFGPLSGLFLNRISSYRYYYYYQNICVGGGPEGHAAACRPTRDSQGRFLTSRQWQWCGFTSQPFVYCMKLEKNQGKLRCGGGGDR